MDIPKNKTQTAAARRHVKNDKTNKDTKQKGDELKNTINHKLKMEWNYIAATHRTESISGIGWTRDKKVAIRDQKEGERDGRWTFK